MEKKTWLLPFIETKTCNSILKLIIFHSIKLRHLGLKIMQVGILMSNRVINEFDSVYNILSPRHTFPYQTRYHRQKANIGKFLQNVQLFTIWNGILAIINLFRTYQFKIAYNYPISKQKYEIRNSYLLLFINAANRISLTSWRHRQ